MYIHIHNKCLAANCIPQIQIYIVELTLYMYYRLINNSSPRLYHQNDIFHLEPKIYEASKPKIIVKRCSHSATSSFTIRSCHHFSYSPFQNVFFELTSTRIANLSIQCHSNLPRKLLRG